MRLAVYLIAGGQFLFLCLAWVSIYLSSTDAAGRGMAYGFLIVGFIALVVVTVPAILLARSEKWQTAGLLLAVSPFLLLIWLNAV